MSVQGTSGVAGGGASASYVVDSEKVTSGCWCWTKKKKPEQAAQPAQQPAPVRRLSSSPNHNRTESAIYAGFKATHGGGQSASREATSEEIIAEALRQKAERLRRSTISAASATLPPPRPPLPDMGKIQELKLSGHHRAALAQHPSPATATQQDAGYNFVAKEEEASAVRADGVAMDVDPTSTVRSR